MKPQIKNQAIHDIEEQIARHESALVPLRADLEVLRTHPPEESTWSAHVISAWSSEGEESWSGTFQAPDLRTAVYKAMLKFCKNAGLSIRVTRVLQVTSTTPSTCRAMSMSTCNSRTARSSVPTVIVSRGSRTSSIAKPRSRRR